jgi:hypothetical protein
VRTLHLPHFLSAEASIVIVATVHKTHWRRGAASALTSMLTSYCAPAAVWLENFNQLAALPPTSFRLPMENDAPDFAWVDVQAGAVAVKHAGVRLFASLQWRHGYQNPHGPRVPSNVALNNVSRVHYTVLGGGDGISQVVGSVDHIINVQMQWMKGANAGWSRLYATEPIGDFVIAMNGAPNETLQWPLPPSYVGRDAVDLISGRKHCDLGAAAPVGPSTAVVLWKTRCLG